MALYAPNYNPTTLSIPESVINCYGGQLTLQVKDTCLQPQVQLELQELKLEIELKLIKCLEKQKQCKIYYFCFAHMSNGKVFPETCD